MRIRYFQLVIFVLSLYALSNAKICTWNDYDSTAKSWRAGTWINGAPGKNDTARFINPYAANCIIDTTTYVNRIEIDSGITGTITLKTGFSITIGSGGFSQRSGTFIGGTSFIFINGDFILSGGIFSSTTRTLYMNGQPGVDNTGNFIITGGTFVHNNGTVKFNHFAKDSSSQTATIAINLPSSNQFTFGSLWFHNPTIRTGKSSSQSYALSSDTLVVTGTYRQSGNNDDSSGTPDYCYVNSGVIVTHGNIYIGSYSKGGTASIVFMGAAPQTLTYGGTAMHTGEWVVNKLSGAVVLGSNISFSGKLRILSGAFCTGASYNLTTSDTLVIGPSGSLIDTGIGDITLGGSLYNNGTVLINANGTGISSTDDILIRSTVSGTQRNWEGSGVFTIIDADVKDQRSTSPIVAISSTNSGNVGANWTFPVDTPIVTVTKPRITSITVPASTFFGKQENLTCTAVGDSGKTLYCVWSITRTFANDSGMITQKLAGFSAQWSSELLYPRNYGEVKVGYDSVKVWGNDYDPLSTYRTFFITSSADTTTEPLVDSNAMVYPVTCRMDSTTGTWIATPVAPAESPVSCRIVVSNYVSNATITVTPKPVYIVSDTTKKVYRVADIKLSSELNAAMQTAEITIAFGGLGINNPDKLRIYYVDSTGTLVDDVIGITVDIVAQTVTGTVTHFSEYALVEKPDGVSVEGPVTEIANGLSIRPNPTNPNANILFSFAKNEHISLCIYNVTGSLVRKLVNRSMTSGHYNVVWDGKDKNGYAMASGRYIVRMEAGDNILNRTLNLVK